MDPFCECTAIVSVADAEPATSIAGLPFTDATFSAGTMITAAAPSPMGEASSKLIGVAIMHDFSNFSNVDLFMQARIRIVHGIRMRVDGERRKVLMLPAELVHVTAHDQGIDPHERNALFHFIICIGGGGQCGSDIVTGFVGHLFDTHHQR